MQIPIRSPYANKNTPKAAPSKFEDFVSAMSNFVDMKNLTNLISDLNEAMLGIEAFKQDVADAHGEMVNKMTEKEKAMLQMLEDGLSSIRDEITALIPTSEDILSQVQVPAPEPINEDSIVEKVLQRIPTPKDGRDGVTPEIDLIEVAKAAAKFVKLPEVKIPEVKIPQIDHNKVAEEVISILEKGDKKLSTKHIGDFTNGLEQTIKPLRHALAGMRGGGDVVSAGTNVTITTDANGKKVISSSGGSGFTALAATETPNGSTTVFTFALASAQPSYLVVDNVWMKATTSAGTVNWTWNNGTKKATLTVPPVDDIWGVV